MIHEAASQEAARPIPTLAPSALAATDDARDNVFLLAFGPADHHFESDDGEEACSYVLGYN